MISPGRFKRVVQFYGEAGFRSIRRSTVLVAGLGGVGSHCALALARTGTGRLILVDFDVVSESSLNRNPLAGPSDIGRMKSAALADALERTCPDTEYVQVNAFLSGEYLSRCPLDGSISAVADAIDSVNPKTHLIQHCIENGIPVFSSMGAAGRRDPSLVRTGDISESGGCPLARVVRKYLRRRGIEDGVTCVWSTEKAVDALPPDDEPRLERRGRIRNSLPSIVTMPGMFGYSLAQLILDRLAGNVSTGRQREQV